MNANDEAKIKEITRLLNSFPQTGGNRLLLLDTYEQQLSGLSIEAVERAVRRFIGGDVPDQNRTFAPSVAEFKQEAQRCQEYLDMLAKPPLPAPVRRSYSGGSAPWERRTEQLRTKYAHLPVLFTDVSHAQAVQLSKDGQIPVGGFWCAGLATVFGPEAARQAA